MRQYSRVDAWVGRLDQGLSTVLGRPRTTGRPNPAEGITLSDELDAAEVRRVVALMRVNHAGEIAAQGLYQGQALTARLPEVREEMERAAKEENDHLAWCECRLRELDARPSLLGPVWYGGSLAIGALAGAVGDRWSLGFVAETERQVERHLDGHLDRLPASDLRSRAILEQMRDDEVRHGETARQAGGSELPAPIKLAMSLVSKIMTATAARI